jgi:CheY-like chemotaxis protein
VEQWANLVQALGSLMWPIIAVVAIVRFEGPIRSIIESATHRKFSLKVGGQELTMEELGEQQRALIADLQTQVAALEPRPSVPPRANGRENGALGSVASPRRILWVDDKPKNNVYLVQMLTENGIAVDTEVSTEGAVARFDPGRYGAVVSDMGRDEGGTYNIGAGIELLNRIRERDAEVPFFIYCDPVKAREYRVQALDNGATDITSSPTTVFGALLRQFNGSEIY